MKSTVFLIIAMLAVNVKADVMPNPLHGALVMEGVYEHTDYINGNKLIQIVVGDEFYSTCRINKGKLVHVTRLRNLEIGFGEKGELKAGSKSVSSFDPYDTGASSLKRLEVGNNYVRHLDTTLRIRANSALSSNRDKYFKKCDALTG